MHESVGEKIILDFFFLKASKNTSKSKNGRYFEMSRDKFKKGVEKKD